MPADAIPRWDMFEATFQGPSDGNPFLDVEFEVVFLVGSEEVRVPGFYDGDGTYKVRFMPEAEGEWSFRTVSNQAALDGKTGRFTCGPARPGIHGPVRVRNQFHFAHADGTRYFPFGTTCYAWTHQGDALEEQTLATLKTAPFNKMRMCVFPKDYIYNENRYRVLKRTNPEEAENLLRSAQELIKLRWETYEHMAKQEPARFQPTQ